MAVLSDNDRAAVWAELMSELSRDREAIGTMTKADLRAAVNGIDDYFNTNAAAMNTAIPQPARAQLSVAQKARLSLFVIRRRYLSGS